MPDEKYLGVAGSSGVYIIDMEENYNIKCKLGECDENVVEALTFAPKLPICILATHAGIYIYNELYKGSSPRIIKLEDMGNTGEKIIANSLCWSKDGDKLFVGGSNGVISSYKAQYIVEDQE